MKSFGNVVPSPGIPELERIARTLIRRLKELKYEDEKQALLGARLESLIECAKQPGDVLELTRRVDGLLRTPDRFEAGVGSSTRLGIILAQRKLALWDELDAKLSRIVEATTLRALARMQIILSEQRATEPSHNKLPIIHSYEITNQIELSRKDPSDSFRGCQCESCVSHRTRSELVIVSCHTGRYGKLSVTYKKFATRSGVTASTYVEEELAEISRYMHPNVAALAGITEGYRGLDGFVVVTSGLPFKQFFSQVCSGAAVAKYAECILSVNDAYHDLGVGDIMVEQDGRAVIFPSRAEARIYLDPGFFNLSLAYLRLFEMTPPVRALTKVIKANSGDSRGPRLQHFLEACRDLGCAFTELEVMRLAASSGLFPDYTSRHFTSDGSRPDYSIRPGDFGIVRSQTTDSGTVEHSWTPLGGSFCPEGWDTTTTGLTFVPIEPRRSKVDGAQWLSYDLASCGDYNGRIGIRIFLKLKSDSGTNWDDIETRAQNLALDKCVDIESVSWYTYVQCNVLIDPQQVHDASQAAETLYFHRSGESTDPLGLWGFLSISADPSCHASREIIEQRGWSPTYKGFFKSYGLSQAWARQHDRMLEEGVATIPGSYPGAHIDEVE